MNSSSFVTNNKVANAMTKLGFEIYDVDSNICKDYDVDKDGKSDFTIKHLTDGFKLETGDFLTVNSDSFHHVHFCLEDEQTNERGGIVNKKKDNFGWGRVYREYPTKYTLTYDSNSKKIKGGYTRVYRYVGR